MGIEAHPEQVRALAQYAEILETEATDLGFLGPNESEQLISRHILESAALAPLLPTDGSIVDVGTGPGLPGLVLAALGARTVLIDSIGKRASFLRRTAETMGVHTDVREGRAEDLGRTGLRESAVGVVARALASPPVALELCASFCRVGGVIALLATPPPEVERDASKRSDLASGGSAEAAARAADFLGCGVPEWKSVLVPGATASRWVMIVRKERPTPERFPRRPGVPKRRPLGGDVASVN